MCGDCNNSHELFRKVALQGHRVTPVRQFQAKDYEAVLKRQSFCTQQYHEREVTRFFCKECQTCVCQICIATSHKTHKVEALEKAADGEKSNILARVELTKQQKNACSDAIRKIEETEAEMETNIASAKREVSHTAGQMVAKIRESERENITALENTRKSRTEKLNSAKKVIQSLAKQVDQALEFADTLVQRSSSSDIIQSKNSLEQRLEDLDKIQLPALPVGLHAKFVPTSAPENLSLGFTTTNKIDVNRSTVLGLTQDFQAGVEGKFVVRPRIHVEEQANRVNSKFHVDVLVEPTEKVSSLIVCDQEDGNFLVKFIPKVPGCFKIYVKINREELGNSPFTVQVKQRIIQVERELDLKGQVQRPCGIAVNSKGLIAIADDEGHCVVIFSKEGTFVRKLGCQGNNAGQLNSPAFVTFLSDDEILVVESNHRVQQLNIHTGNFVKSFGKKGTRDGEFEHPVSLCLDGEGHFVVTEFNNNRVQVLSEDGEPVFKFGESEAGKLRCPLACIYHKNNFIVSDAVNNCLKVFNSSGKFLYKIGEQERGDGQMVFPWGLCVEQCGNHQNLLVCNSSNGRVDQLTVEGTLTGKTVAKLPNPATITTTPDGFILVCDWTAKKIYVLK